MSEVRLSKKIGPAFFPLARDVFRHGHTHYDLSGGRGSLKSSCVSILVPLLLKSNPGTHALVLRKVANTIRDSVYAQYIWAIGELGMANYWEAKVSPLELIYKPTGQKIMFRGADDPMKIKSIKVPFGYIAITHFEEKDQFCGRGEIRSILQSTMRGGSKFWNFESYNPPISLDNWANKDSLEERADRLCHKSTYLEAPPEWLGEQFIAEAEHLKAVNERAYQHEYLGIPVGTGGEVFPNLEIREITQSEIDHLGYTYQGLDFGFAQDPLCFVRASFDRRSATIYVLDEIYKRQMSNYQIVEELKKRQYDKVCTTCDDADPKSIMDLRDSGVYAIACYKRPGCVEYRVKWMQHRKIVIDPKRTPNTYREFSTYSYDMDKDGNFISRLPDKDNHSIDALAYALEPLIYERGTLA